MNDEYRSGIYSIRLDWDRRIYVGSAASIKDRWVGHRMALRAGRHHSIRLQKAWDEYGEDAFDFEVLEYVSDADELIAREQHWIDVMNAADKDVGFNILPFAWPNKRTGAIPPRVKRRQIALPDPLDTFITARAATRGVEWSEIVREGLLFFMEAVESQSFYAPQAQRKLPLEDRP